MAANSGAFGGQGPQTALRAAGAPATRPAAPGEQSRFSVDGNRVEVDRKGQPQIGMPYAQTEAAGPESSVSPAVLTALQRSVEVKTGALTVQQVAAQLAEAADVPVQVDPRIRLTSIQVRKDKAPLWQVLQTIAQQQHLQVYPQDNELVLMLSPKPAAGAMKGLQGAPQREPQGERPKPEDLQRGRNALAEKGGAPAQKKPVPLGVKPPASRAGPRPEPVAGAAPGRSDAPVMESEGAAAGPAPDPKVWPAGEWGRLPGRGFALPETQAVLPEASTPALENQQLFQRQFRRQAPLLPVPGQEALPAGHAAPQNPAAQNSQAQNSPRGVDNTAPAARRKAKTR
jgi:hypothetical protein